jgi:periplasmic protein TonB
MSKAMKTDIKNLDDIIFDKRNKDYGAYFLRKNYNTNVVRALFIALFLFSAVVSIPLIAGLMHFDQRLTNEVTLEMDANLLAKPPVKEELPELPEQKQQTEERVAVFTPPVVVTDTAEVTTEDFGELIEATKDGVINENEREGDIIVVENPKVKEVIETPVLEKAFTFVELMPTFKGGEKEMYAWLSNQIVYPVAAKETNIQGTVIVTFVVEKDGSITGVEVLRDIGGGCGEEALRVVKAMPKWNEGRQNNVPVRVQFTLPIKFVLE